MTMTAPSALELVAPIDQPATTTNDPLPMDLCLLCAEELGETAGTPQIITKLIADKDLTRIWLSCGHLILTWA